MLVKVLKCQRFQLFVELYFNISRSQFFTNEFVDCLDNFPSQHFFGVLKFAKTRVNVGDQSGLWVEGEQTFEE